MTTDTNRLRELLKLAVPIDLLRELGYPCTAELVEAIPSLLDTIDALESRVAELNEEG